MLRRARHSPVYVRERHPARWPRRLVPRPRARSVDRETLMPSQLRKLRNVLLAAAVLTLPCVGIAVGPTRPAMVRPQVPGGGLNPASFYGKESFQGVSVRDSLEAIKKLEDARRMERLQDWNKAADWYQEVLEKYGQYVVPSGTDAQNN